ncbi:MAG: SWIM zinc finger family protein [Synergistaceae bacterium]|jgi:uncharacterized Zn finger protein|nr:SWIM zinc finger family protein [Synergistaceae bacterium]
MDKTAKPGKRAYRRKNDSNLSPYAGIKSGVESGASQRWTARWLASITRIVGPRRVTAAKNYVRSGHVIEINVSPGLIEAKVRDKRKKPYQVRLYSPTPAADQISAIIRGLSERAIYGALLLSGDMPADIGKIFSDAGADFPPYDFKGCKRLCSCPEQGEDCKHIIAALLVSVDAFDRDPFLMLKNRGIDRERLISCLTARRGSPDGMRDETANVRLGCSPATRPDERAPDMPGFAETAGSAAPFSTDVTFYGTGQLHERLADIRGDAMESDDLPRDVTALFAFPLWRGEASFKESIDPYYENVKRFIRERY